MCRWAADGWRGLARTRRRMVAWTRLGIQKGLLVILCSELHLAGHVGEAPPQPLQALPLAHARWPHGATS